MELVIIILGVLNLIFLVGLGFLMMKTLNTELRDSRKELTQSLKIIQEGNEKERQELTASLKSLQEGNEKKLEQMRETVDEKLQASVEKRFNESFKEISTQLSEVYKGLGEMKHLATGVGDLKKVMEEIGRAHV